jgi:DNA-binding response OmpR family regulator
MTESPEITAPLTPLERRIIDALPRDGEPPKSKYVIGDEVYADAAVRPGDAVIPVKISALRKKLAGTGLTIETVWGKGYRLKGNPDD